MQVVIAQPQFFEACVVGDLSGDCACEAVVVQQQTLQPPRARERKTYFPCREGRYLSCEAVVGQVQRYKALQPAKRCGHGPGQAVV